MRDGVPAVNEGCIGAIKSKGTNPAGNLQVPSQESPRSLGTRSSYPLGSLLFLLFRRAYKGVGKRRPDHLIQLCVCLLSGTQLEVMFPPHPFSPMRKDICQTLRPSQNAGLGGGATLLSLRQVLASFHSSSTPFSNPWLEIN